MISNRLSGTELISTKCNCESKGIDKIPWAVIPKNQTKNIFSY